MWRRVDLVITDATPKRRLVATVETPNLTSQTYVCMQIFWLPTHRTNLMAYRHIRRQQEHVVQVQEHFLSIVGADDVAVVVKRHVKIPRAIRNPWWPIWRQMCVLPPPPPTHKCTSHILYRRANIYSSRCTTLFKIWGFHGGDYEEWCLLGCYAVWLL
jgi:hypothetical protein